MKNVNNRTWRTTAIAALATVLIIGVPASSWGYWNASTALSATITTGTVPAPTSFACKPSGGLLGLGSTANYAWMAPAGDPGWRYLVHLRSADGSIEQVVDPAGQSATSIKLGQGILTGLLGGILELLLGNQQIYVSVTTVHPSGWVSQKTDEIPMRRASLLGGITC